MTQTIEQLQAKVAELEEENERLKVDRAKKQKESVTIFDVNCELRQQLAAAQEQLAIRTQEFDAAWRQLAKAEQRVAKLGAENAKLPEQVDLQVPKTAFTQLKEQLAAEQLNNKLLRDALEFLNARIVTMDLGGVVERALSLPPSTEALDAYVAAKVKEAGKFDMWKINPYTKVLETSIKQLTKQRDLAVEALEKASDGIKAELSDNWTCNSYHPKLFAGEKAIDEAMSAIKESEGK
jgi:multidrug efflux pump subunit AcrA (membrane-fusion protein)